MMEGNPKPNTVVSDAFRQLVTALDSVSEEQASLMLAKLVLLLVEELGDAQVFTRALELANKRTEPNAGLPHTAQFSQLH